ncbi:histone deacetylase family protein [Natronocalculus amylovorans]|uniref:Histone deacetylase n=1 Tax=Natronocalculus amylovorans TaxID=2917812 RepID=A0AAE3FUU7_9EURY|nr:histone deacetylase [Natronocalculus amylovorans]MCL9815626.1 histone deacetylase [Natronocalculus amylovorans]
MQFGYSDTCLEHDTGTRHPETPDRLRAIKRGLQKRHGVVYHDSERATKASVSAVHDADYVDEVESFCNDGGGNWDPDTVACEKTWDAALQSAGLAEWAVKESLEGADGRQTPFAVGRPPGHHAVYDDAMGFCFFNNAAVAAQTALNEYPIDRVAIFDWDVHHGNGTQDIFYERDDVFYASIHEDGLYPGTGAIEEIGADDGDGTTLNAPLPVGAGDAEYMHVIDAALIPALEAFDPDALIISAGFDAHRHDPISRMRVSTEGYALMTDRMRTASETIGAPLSFVLEGGYGLDTLADGVSTVHETFDGREPMPCEDEPDGQTIEITDELRDRLGI